MIIDKSKKYLFIVESPNKKSVLKKIRTAKYSQIEETDETSRSLLLPDF